MSNEPESNFEKKVARRLRAANIRFDTQKTIGGFQPDFILYAPDGRQFVVEAKGWDFPGFTRRASKQADLLQRASGVDHVFFVFADLKRNDPQRNAYNIEGLIPALETRLEKKKPRRHPPSPKKRKRSVFAAMPFAPEYDDVFFLAMAYAAEQVQATCRRVDREEFQGNVVEEVKRLIRAADAVFVDLSQSKPNVLYEAGFAHALEKPCIHICSTDMGKLPFDVAQWKTTKYTKGQVHKLRGILVKRLTQIIA